MKKYILTENKINFMGKTLYEIKAVDSFGDVEKGDLGGYIEKEENLSHEGNAWVSGNARVYGDAIVSGDARVYGDAWVYGSAWVSGKYNYKKGKFIGGDDSCKITRIEEKMGTDYWQAQYVLGDYEITPQEKEKKKIIIDGKEIEISEESYNELKKSLL